MIHLMILDQPTCFAKQEVDSSEQSSVHGFWFGQLSPSGLRLPFPFQAHSPTPAPEQGNVNSAKIGFL